MCFCLLYGRSVPAAAHPPHPTLEDTQEEKASTETLFACGQNLGSVCALPSSGCVTLGESLTSLSLFSPQSGGDKDSVSFLELLGDIYKLSHTSV